MTNTVCDVRRLRLLATLVLTACGGGGTVDAPPSSPPPVASVSVTPGTANLVPLETTQLTAAVTDTKGGTVTRAVSWSSSSQTVATVSANGLVSAVAPGQSTITATLDGQSGTAVVTVAEGGSVSPAGGTIVAVGGAITLVIPAGAVPAKVAVAVNPISDAVADPEGYWLSGGVRYQLGPNGTQFAQPVTVTIRYDQTALPPWALPGDLTIQRWNGTQWQPLSNVVVDPVARTVSGQTSGFSTFAVATTLPPATLTPGQGSVNQGRRSVVFAATIPGSNRPSNALQYVWTTTGSNGGLGAQLDNTIQYTASVPILPAGDLDFVRVEIRGRRDPNGPFVGLASAITSVKADLNLTVELQPSSSLVQYSGSVPLSAVIFDRAGNLAQVYGSPELYFEWTATQNAGTVSLGTQRTQSKAISYTAFPPSQQSAVFPKGDKITVKALVRVPEYEQAKYDPILGKLISRVIGETFTPIGQADAIIEVIPRYVVKLVPASTDLVGGQQVGLRVELEPAWQGTESLSFRWRNTANYGDLSVPLGTLTQQGTANYLARSGQGGGSDLVEVDVHVGIISRLQLGTAQAVVQVGPRVTAMWRIETATVTRAGTLNDPDVDLLYYNYVVNGMNALAARPGDNHIYVSAGEARLQQVPAGQGANVRGIVEPPRAIHYGLADDKRFSLGPLGGGGLSGEYWIGTDELDPTSYVMKNTINTTMTPGVLQGSFTVMAWPGVVYTVTFRALQIIP